MPSFIFEFNETHEHFAPGEASTRKHSNQATEICLWSLPALAKPSGTWLSSQVPFFFVRGTPWVFPLSRVTSSLVWLQFTRFHTFISLFLMSSSLFLFGKFSILYPLMLDQRQLFILTTCLQLAGTLFCGYCLCSR